MNFEQPQLPGQSEKEKIKQQCRELEIQIEILAEESKKLTQQGQEIRNLEQSKKFLVGIENDLETARKRLAEWPRGLFGLKDKKGYQDFLVQIEKLKKNLEIEQKYIKNYETKVNKHERLKTIEELEKERVSLQEKIKELKWNRRKLGLKLFEKSGDTSLETALEIYGDLFYGPEEVQKEFGISLSPEDIPALPPKEKLEKVKNIEIPSRSVILALKIQENQEPEWRLFPNGVVNPETVFKDYVEETRGIREFLKKHGLISQQELDEASDEILNQLAALIKTDEEEAFLRLINMKINQKRRHTVEEMIYFVRLIRGEAFSKFRIPQKVLDGSYESTKSFIKDKQGIWIQRIGKFTESRGGGYMKEESKPTSRQTSGFGSYYETGVRIIL